ncbi:unnamed protein product [Didymodactylos carnosus]|uniref:VWFA domain-containing protein n=1 Tax=Didymodactylos carnosus TaxID=1234261 RepID=A0A814S5Y1_9BILA|nr:unnamed protein product [Didymodactylos carnosus]CAF1143076.1 unnamed protein product [Didymodactylos carnosus]CAF3587483.1 unnamed protein product [Didymodactylos carnosus]CAF3906703.1 unnamed protein product [Didymodactylos carnosus]
MNIITGEGKFEKHQNIFVGAFGLNNVPTCDLLALLDYARKFDVTQPNSCGHGNLIELLKGHGAPYCDQYVRKYLKASKAQFFAKFFSENLDELSEIIRRLPKVCKTQVELTADGLKAGLTKTSLEATNWISFFTGTPDVGESFSRKEADEMIEYAKSVIRKRCLPTLQAMAKPQIKSFESTVNLLNGMAKGATLSTTHSFTSEQLSGFVASIDPFIYGNTPMCQALSYATEIFTSSTDPVKVLFLISDGESTDGDPAQFAKRLHDNKVIVFCCLLTFENLSQPRRLYYEPDVRLTKAQHQMFQLSSTVENSHSGMLVLLEQKWELPAAGHSGLFVQGNHPDIMNEYSDLVRQLAQKNDVLLNNIGRVSLDMYINAANASFEPKRQRGGTCYAHTVAAVLHLAMRRIEGRENGVPDFFDICQKLINTYGEKGAVTTDVLNIWAPKYRLRHRKVDETGARQAINHRRPVVATFCLDKKQWTNFSEFYGKSPQGVLESKDIGARNAQSKIDGHAVVLIKY